ncbi:ice-binding family protein [Colwellia hornerae]|uniref:ice-binding family protein n=1 Tax=Colwellia hornerae TaxID=89402 RepID=UPI001CC21488|nr:ice-binding family protein [Colwellia hornerae]
MKLIKLLLFFLVLSAVPSAQASFQPLLGSDLNNQSLYASGYITMGARTTIGGNIQSATAITLAANAIVGGNIEAGTAVTLGAAAGVNGYIQSATTVTLGASAVVDGSITAGTTATVGASAKIDGELNAGTTVTIAATVEVGGNVLAGSTVTVGASSLFGGDVDAGTTTTIGAGVGIVGALTASSLKIVALPTIVNSQEALITSVQQDIKDLGTGTELVSTTFGTNDETLEAGIYSTINYLTIAIGKTLTLDGKGMDGSWIFNIANYLTFSANAKVILKDVTDNSTIIWNVLGDKTGSAGYTQLGAGAEARGYIFARGFVQTGADSMIAGIGNDCGGAYSASNFIEFGADTVIGKKDCTNGERRVSADGIAVTQVPEPATLWLFALALFGLAIKAQRKFGAFFISL